MTWLDGITDSMDMFEQALGVGGQGSLAAVHGVMKSLFMFTESVTPSNHLILCHPLLLLLSIFPSIRVFPSEFALHIRWPSIGASASALVFPINVQG